MKPTGHNQLTSVLIPMITREINDLKKLFLLWGMCGKINELADKPKNDQVTLIITLDCAYSEQMENEITQIYRLLEIDKQFPKLRIEFCALSPEENIYIRHGQVPPPTLPPMGLKSGPNMQFFRSIRDFCQNENTVLLHEVDCFPVRPDWLENLVELTTHSEIFWVLGSPYRGTGKLGPDIVSHVNGNALYGVGTPGFRDFLDNFWYNGLLEDIKRAPWLAYDIFISYKFSKITNPNTWNEASIDLFQQYAETLCKIRYTNAIHNLGGEEDIAKKVRFDLTAYLTNQPGAAISHGRFLFDPILTLLKTKLREKNQHEWAIKLAWKLWESNEKKLSKILTQELLA